MGLTYDASTGKYNVTYQKTDYKTDYATNRIIKHRVEKGPITEYTVQTRFGTQSRLKQTVYIYGVRPNGTKELIKSTEKSGIGYKDGGTYNWTEGTDTDIAALVDVYQRNADDWNNTYSQSQIDANALGAKFNSDNTNLNNTNTQLNNAYNTVLTTSTNTAGGDYVSRRQSIRNLSIASDTKKQLESAFKDFYRDQKLQTWDSNLGTQPPYGTFDGSFYGSTYTDVANSWNYAKSIDNIDITERYGSSNGYYLYHYTTNGKKEGRRGNPVEATEQANTYVETKPTDQEIQEVRDRQLGVDIDTTSDRLLNIPYIADEWEKAKQGDAYWAELAKDKYLDINKSDDFAALFRLSQRDQDKQISLEYNLNLNYGITELENAINETVGEKAVVDTKKFGALAQDVLKETIQTVKEAKAKETEIDFLSNFGGIGEILNINETLSNSLLGDSGIGGVLAITGDKENFEKSFKSGISNVTGIDTNIVSYNWQKWFDETLSQRYQENLNLGLSEEEAQQQIAIEKEFAQNFVVEYLTPRFNESKSMDEFVEYIDVRQEEQNPFQTQSMLDAVATLANLRAEEYLTQVQNTEDRRFNADFYFNPTGNSAKEQNYTQQKTDVESAWESAKQNPNELIDSSRPELGTWAQQAYRFGLDLSDKDNFARVHFQVIGQGKGYDPAEDVLTAGKVKDLIYNNILPALKDEALQSDTVFGQFITPAEFADDILEGLDPNEPETWQEALKSIGIDDFEGSVEELKEYIINVLRTGSATEIRQQIKYLNEKREEISQKTLGVTYIEREEDAKPESQEAETELYQRFKDAGFQGTEEEFYKDFMPDTSIEDQKFLTSASLGRDLTFNYGNYEDPFEALSNLQQFTSDEEDEEQEEKNDQTKSKNSLFDLSLDLDDTDDYKSDSGRSFLNQFTSGFTFNK